MQWFPFSMDSTQKERPIDGHQWELGQTEKVLPRRHVTSVWSLSQAIKAKPPEAARTHLGPDDIDEFKNSNLDKSMFAQRALTT